jgi:hypothetical protein
MSSQPDQPLEGTTPSIPVPDLVITALLLIVFVGGLQMARDFPFRAGLVPRIVCGAGIVFCVLHLVKPALATRTAASSPSAASHAGASAPRVLETGEVLVEDDEEYVFATSTRASWLEALGWFGGFFVALAVFGILIAVPVFAFAYLVVVGRVRIVWAVVYAAASWAFLYGIFDRTLHLALPTGLLT